MQMIGTYDLGLSFIVYLEQIPTYFCLLYERDKSCDSTTITRGHAVHFVHDQHRSVCDLDSGNIRGLHLIISYATGLHELILTSPPPIQPSSDVLLMLAPFF